MDLNQYLQSRGEMVNQALAACWPEAGHPLFKAMNYSLLGSGKRLRPILCLAAHEAAGGHSANAMYCALALEMIHCYSLIHDDLPAMDNDDYRRGRPTNHKVYGEAMAILAGDGLLSQAFVLLASPPAAINAKSALEVSRLVAIAAGPQGMVGGQADDMGPPTFSLQYLKNIHARKTGALISAALISGAKLAEASDEFMDILAQYGEKIGLAFQIADDILDVEGSREELGKSIGKDAAQGKLTYPALLGLEAARQMGRELVQEAQQLAGKLGAEVLRLIPAYIMNRSR